MPILNWLTRETDLQATTRIPYRLLEEDPNLSIDTPDSGNLLIQGDNLEALKALLPFYAGQVKCVYIDPPYNTRSAFEHYDDSLEHSKWLTMIWPRLEFLRELLSEDGTVWVSIDDNEAHYLKVVMDEVFGRKNFVANVIWEKKYAPQNDAKWLSDSHDHIFCYAKAKDVWRPNLLPRTDEMNARYKNPDNDPRGPWKISGLDVKTYSATYDYPITTPTGRVVNPPPGRCWVVSKERFQELVSDNRIWFGKNGNNVPSIKRFLSDVKQGMVIKTIWYRNEVGDNQEARREARVFNESDVFATPKSERLIQRILHIATNPGDLVLDSFLGSGTTAAVAHKMDRRYIGIEMGEHAVTHCVPRLNKVIEGEQGGISKSVGWKGGGGFRFYRLGPPVFDAEGQIRSDVTFPVLAAHVYFSETGRPLPASDKSPLLGIHDGRAYALLYNGVLGDRKPDSGNVLTRPTLARIRREITRRDAGFAGPLTVYGEQSRLSQATLAQQDIVFKQTPYDIKARA